MLPELLHNLQFIFQKVSIFKNVLRLCNTMSCSYIVSDVQVLQGTLSVPIEFGNKIIISDIHWCDTKNLMCKAYVN